MTYRKIPGINTYTAEQPEKEQEVIPTVTSIDVPNPEGERLTSLERVDAQPDSKSRGINASCSFSAVAPHILIGQKRLALLFVDANVRVELWEEALWGLA